MVPAVVVGYVAEQLGLEPAALAGYGTAEARWDHQEQIRDGYGYTKFEFDQWFTLARWMYQRAWIGSERPTLLFDLATKRLVDKKVVLPGVTVLERLVSGTRERVERRLWATLAAAPTAGGIELIVHDGVDALNRDRLFWVEQNYVRAATLSMANARLVDYHMRLPLVQAWGGGEPASADGLRFVAPIRTLNSGPNPKYFGTRRRGVAFYNFLSDQFSGLHGILIPGTQRDSFYILDGLLEQETALRPVEITSDTHGASEIVFGLFRLMGYQFSPRLADVGRAILYRAEGLPESGDIFGGVKAWPMVMRAPRAVHGQGEVHLGRTGTRTVAAIAARATTRGRRGGVRRGTCQQVRTAAGTGEWIDRSP